MLIMRNLTKAFGKKLILKNIDLEIKKGSVTLLLGSSGVGKSTLLRVLAGLEKVDDGSIVLNNEKLDMQNINKDLLFGMVFQHFNLFSNLSVIDNISFPLQKIKKIPKEKADASAKILLRKYGLEDKAHVSTTGLSGGQKQRLAIARTIALQPRIICMDEPTSALDPLLTAYVAQTIQELAREGFSVIIATHDTFLLEKIPCTIHLMQDGSIVESAQSNLYWKSPENFSRIDAFIKGQAHKAINQR